MRLLRVDVVGPALAGLALVAVLVVTIVSYTQRSQAVTTWQVGDVFLGVANGSYQVRAPNGTLKETLNAGASGYTTGCALDTDGNFYGTEFSNNIVRKYLGPGAPHTASTFGGGHNTPESIVFDAAGNVYVGNVFGFVEAGIRKFAPDGTFLQTIINTRVDFFDIAADQDTIYYTQEGVDIKAVSISSGPLPNFTTGTASSAFALRILGDGGVLLADGGNVKRYNSAGAVIQTYDQSGEDTWFSLNLDPNGTSFWAGNYGTANYYKFNIASGLVEAGPFNTGTGGSTLFGICLLGELTVAVPTPTLTATPTATHTPAPNTNTPTSTATNTPVPPTNTFTPTATLTPAPPTATAVILEVTSTPSPPMTPGPVGGISLDPRLPGSSGSDAGLLTGVIAVAMAGASALGGAAWYVRRRSVR